MPSANQLPVCNPRELRPLPAEPLVAILVSNYNYARYIGASIQSALEQACSNIELIVCDDGSADDSVSVILGQRSCDALWGDQKRFLEVSPYLPCAVIDFAIKVMIRQSWPKQLISRVKKMS